MVGRCALGYASCGGTPAAIAPARTEGNGRSVGCRASPARRANVRRGRCHPPSIMHCSVANSTAAALRVPTAVCRLGFDDGRTVGARRGLHQPSTVAIDVSVMDPSPCGLQAAAGRGLYQAALHTDKWMGQVARPRPTAAHIRPTAALSANAHGPVRRWPGERGMAGSADGGWCRVCL